MRDHVSDDDMLPLPPPERGGNIRDTGTPGLWDGPTCLWLERHEGWAETHPEKMLCITHDHTRPKTTDELMLVWQKEEKRQLRAARERKVKRKVKLTIEGNGLIDGWVPR